MASSTTRYISATAGGWCTEPGGAIISASTISLTADLHLGATSLRIGYKGNLFSSKVNHTVTHIYEHALVIGISGEWLSYDPRRHRSSSRTKAVSPL